MRFPSFQSFRTQAGRLLAGRALDEIIAAKLREAQTATDSDDYLYRSITDPNNKRDLSPIAHDRHIDIAYKLWLQNPLAKQLVRTFKNFSVGGGVKILAKDQKIQEIIDGFWSDPRNAMNLRLPDYCEALSVFGEQIFAPFVNDQTGLVHLAYVDAKSVASIATDPEDAQRPVAVVLRGTGGKEGKRLKVIQVDEDPNSKTAGRLVGDAFYFKINSLPNGSRGFSDILANADWLDGYDQFLFNMVDRSYFLNAFLWHFMIEGADSNKLEEFKKANRLPNNGGMLYTNEKVKLEAVNPDLKSSDSAELFKIFRTQIIGGMGFPLHWFGDGSDANLATAGEMGWPTYKMLEERQAFIKHMIETIIKYVIDQAFIHRGSLKEVAGRKAIEDDSFEVQMPELNKREISKNAASFQQIINGLVAAKTQGWISDETALKIIAVAAEAVGVEVDPAEELEKAQASAEDADGEDYKNLPIERIKGLIAKDKSITADQVMALFGNGKKPVPEPFRTAAK
jgi:hypothetical protein